MRPDTEDDALPYLEVTNGQRLHLAVGFEGRVEFNVLLDGLKPDGPRRLCSPSWSACSTPRHALDGMT